MEYAKRYKANIVLKQENSIFAPQQPL